VYFLEGTEDGASQTDVLGFRGNTLVAGLWFVSLALYFVVWVGHVLLDRSQTRARILERINLIPVPILVADVDKAMALLAQFRVPLTGDKDAFLRERPELPRHFLGLIGFRFANQAALRELGGNSLYELQTRQREIVSDEAADMIFRTAADRVLNNLEPVMTVELLTLRGEKRYYFARWIPIPGGRWTLKTNTIVLTDHTDQEMAKRELERRERLLEGIFRASPLGHAFLRHRVLEWVNPRFEEILGYSPGELQGKSTRVLFVNEEQFLDFASYGYPADLDDAPVHHDMVMIGKNGMPCECRLNIAYLEKNNPDAGAIILCEDITPHRLAQSELNSARLQLINAQRIEMQGLLLGGAAHDLSNILTAILLQLGISGEAGERPSVTDVRELDVAARQGISLTRQLLRFGRHDEKRRVLFNVADSLQAMIAVFGRCFGSSVECRLELSAPSLPMVGDREMIEQIWMNLLLNARQAMKEGGRITISASCVPATQVLSAGECCLDDTYILVKVTDTGIGFRAEEKPHLFRPFVTTRREQGGTGLGLPLVEIIAQQHRGWVNAYSEPGKGSTFLVHLPLAKAQGEVPEQSPRGLIPATVDLGRGGLAILIEPDAQVRKRVALLLRLWGYRVQEREGLKGSSDGMSQPVLVVADALQAGDVDECLTLLRSQFQGIFLLLFVASGKPSEIHQVDHLVGVLEKPFDAVQLFRMLQAPVGITQRK
jgi:PAS domain S-box-containing protein